jgi:hypothetical protein
MIRTPAWTTTPQTPMIKAEVTANRHPEGPPPEDKLPEMSVLPTMRMPG